MNAAQEAAPGIMKIAQVSPLYECVPPTGYGGTERVVSYLTEELVSLGHEVTLFASGDSITRATLVPVVEKSIRDEAGKPAGLAYHMIEMDLVAQRAADFDVIHFHTDYLHFPMTRNLGRPHITTLHGRLDLPELIPLYRHFDQQPLISISDSQRTPLPWANWCATVQHGLPSTLYPFCAKPDDYFVYIGRISPEKRVDRAIEIACACATRLTIAAKIDHLDEPYFNEAIKPLLAHPLIDYIGEVNESQKRTLLSQARALLFPIDWPEPFGLVMIEAFACGTPVIAYRHGSVPEVMQDGVTGYIVDSQEQAILAARKIDELDRRRCHAVFAQRFTATRMAQDYCRIYWRMAGRLNGADDG